MWLFKKKKYQSDEELAQAYYETGDKELVGELFEKHVKLVFGACLFYFKDKETAKDIVMQIFEKLITDLRKTRVDNFKGWLGFVVRSHCINELRKNKKFQFVTENYLDFEVTPNSYETEEKINSISDDKMLELMTSSIHLLKENQRICIELFYLKNQSYQQVSEATKLSLNEVKSNIQNGKRNLKLLIEEKIRNKNHAA